MTSQNHIAESARLTCTGNQLNGKVAVITGGTQGLGAAIARQFAHNSVAGLVICGRNQAKGEAIVSEISQLGIPCYNQVADLEHVADCRSVIAAADKTFGRVDVLVNAAGLTDRGDLLSTSPELFDRMFAINTRAPFFLMQDAVKLMIRDSLEGAIVNIGSISSLSGQPFIAPYCASKGALATLTRNSAFALLRNRIRVNQLDIGWMSSDGEDRIQKLYHGASDNWAEEAGKTQPFGRLVDPKEVARAVAFLASADSGLMTGAVIPLDQSIYGGFESAPARSAPLAL